jgi:hypothetical protein
VKKGVSSNSPFFLVQCHLSHGPFVAWRFFCVILAAGFTHVIRRATVINCAVHEKAPFPREEGFYPT